MVKKENIHKQISLRINGKEYVLKVLPEMMLVDLLRDKLKLTGTKVGCRKGECGACTVLMEGKPIISCMYPALKANGKKITTIEGLSKGVQLHPLQDSFIKYGAVQCGFCTPGMIMASKALLDQNSNPKLIEIKEALSGNLCRCGGYQKIFKAVISASKKMRRVK